MRYNLLDGNPKPWCSPRTLIDCKGTSNIALLHSLDYGLFFLSFYSSKSYKGSGENHVLRRLVFIQANAALNENIR